RLGTPHRVQAEPRLLASLQGASSGKLLPRTQTALAAAQAPRARPRGARSRPCPPGGPADVTRPRFATTAARDVAASGQAAPQAAGAARNGAEVRSETHLPLRGRVGPPARATHDDRTRSRRVRSRARCARVPRPASHTDRRAKAEEGSGRRERHSATRAGARARRQGVSAARRVWAGSVRLLGRPPDAIRAS